MPHAAPTPAAPTDPAALLPRPRTAAKPAATATAISPPRSLPSCVTRGAPAAAAATPAAPP